jgi:NAD(P)-dependent dehydrogenase (short-subunit alcohol dehydrogenase family)
MDTRVCLVTGAGRGIGRVVAATLSAAGHRVALTARHRDQLDDTARSLPGPTLVLPGDVTDPTAVEDVFAEVERAWGPVEVLVANAGAATSAPLHRTTDAIWQSMLEVNLTAPFRFLRRAVPSMRQRGYGRIVVVASTAAKRGAPYIAAYAAAKHGVLGLVRAAAAELAGTGVTVNAVCPGYVDTPMTDESVVRIAETTGRDPAQAREMLARAQPIGRLISPEEVARVVAMLVDDPGAITGQGINIDGGGVMS